MLEGSSAVFGTVGLLVALFGVAGLFLLLRNLARRNRVLATGITVEARCLDTYTSRSAEGPSSRRAILGFTTREGREIRIEPAVTGPIVTGDFVPVRYAPERPELAFVVETGRGNALGNGCALVIGMFVCGMFILVGLVFAAGGFGLWDFLSSNNSTDPSGYVPYPSFGP
jgi:hypothetical protein